MAADKVSNPSFFKYSIDPSGLHIDYLRLACGTEEEFRSRWRKRARKPPDRSSIPSQVFSSFGEWDVVTMQPCRSLWRGDHCSVVESPELAALVVGSTGYTNYVWNHPLNAGWKRRLGTTAPGRPALLVCIRFRHWLRRAVGLGAELLLCDYLKRRIGEAGGRASALACHGVGWYDASILFWPPTDQEDWLLLMLQELRTLSLEEMLGTERFGEWNRIAVEERTSEAAGPESEWLVVAATYSHLLVALKGDSPGSGVHLGKLTRLLDSGRVIIRADPSLDPHLQKVSEEGVLLGSPQREFGRYSYSVSLDVSGERALDQVLDLRRWIRSSRNREGLDDGTLLTETTTVLRTRLDSGTREHREAEVGLRSPGPAASELMDLRERILSLLGDLQELEEDAISDMTRYRFASVLAALVAHLSDPVRGTVVHHLSDFVASRLEGLVNHLPRRGQEDLSQLLEYTLNQAVDGLIQFQHDAHTLGLTGRGGYSRLADSLWLYVRDFFDYLELEIPEPLLTFGFRTGERGTADKYRIDVPYSVLNMVSRWHVILHELAHLCWGEAFGDYPENWAVYRAHRRELGFVDTSSTSSEEETEGAEDTHRLFFLRIRSLLVELYPHYVVCSIVYWGNRQAYVRSLLRNALREAERLPITRLLLSICIHEALLATAQRASGEQLHDFELIEYLSRSRGEAEGGDFSPAAPLERFVRRVQTLSWWTVWFRNSWDGRTVEDLARDSVDVLRRAMDEIEVRKPYLNPHLPSVLKKRSFRKDLEKTLRGCFAGMRVLARREWQCFVTLPEAEIDGSASVDVASAWRRGAHKLMYRLREELGASGNAEAEEQLKHLICVTSGRELVSWILPFLDLPKNRADESEEGDASDLTRSSGSMRLAGALAAILSTAAGSGGESRSPGRQPFFEGETFSLDLGWILIAGVERFQRGMTLEYPEEVWTSSWIADFLTNGEILSNCPLGPALSAMLERARNELGRKKAARAGEERLFVGQLSAMLSMWHRAAMMLGDPQSYLEGQRRLKRLGLIEERKAGSPSSNPSPPTQTPEEP